MKNSNKAPSIWPAIWIEGLFYVPRVLKRGFLWFTLVLLFGILGDYLQGLLRRIDDRVAVPIGLVSLVIYLFLGAFGTIIINQIVIDIKTSSKNSLWGALKKNIKYVFIETTRALVPILLK